MGKGLVERIGSAPILRSGSLESGSAVSCSVPPVVLKQSKKGRAFKALPFAAPISTSSLEADPQRQLDLSGCGRRLEEPPEASIDRAASSMGIPTTEIDLKVGAIENVEKLGSELNLCCLTGIEVLEHREIHRGQSRSYPGISTNVGEITQGGTDQVSIGIGIAGLNKGELLIGNVCHIRDPPAVGILGFGEWNPGSDAGEDIAALATGAKGVAVDGRRRAGRQGNDPIDLPALDQLAHESRSTSPITPARPKGQLHRPVGAEGVLNAEGGQPSIETALRQVLGQPGIVKGLSGRASNDGTLVDRLLPGIGNLEHVSGTEALAQSQGQSIVIGVAIPPAIGDGAKALVGRRGRSVRKEECPVGILADLRPIGRSHPR